MIKKITFIIIILMIILLYKQETLIYPGIGREIDYLHPVTKEPFELIDTSYYKQGTTGNIWILLGGNASLPSDYISYVKHSKNSILLLTYPGFNKTKLRPNLDNINLVIDCCIKKLNKRGYHNENISFICYSIGCAAGINYLSTNKLKINKLILLAPFYNISKVIEDNYYIPQFISNSLLDHVWDNHKIKDIHQSINVIIIHGKNDKLINVKHSEILSKVRFSKLIITEDCHNTITRLINDYIN